MNLVDGLMIGAVIVFALVGWRQGFVAGALSFLGFLGGGVLAVLWLPDLVERFVSSSGVRVVVVAVGVIVSAVIGQILLTAIGRRLRATLTWRPVRLVDNLAGAVLNVLALALVAWVVASVVAYLPRSEVTRQVNGSVVLATMDSLLPDQARSAFDGLSDLVGSTAVPRVFAGLASVPGPQVEAPPSEVSAEAVAVIRESTVRLTGAASRCDSIVTGSGFAVEPELIVTNAHVVAGVDDLMVRVRPGQVSLRAEVVYFDPLADLALVRTRGLQARPVRLARSELDVGQAAVIAGFPRGERFEVESARVRARVDARGSSIYGDAGVERDVYVLRARVQQGNSGGPLADEYGDVHGVIFAAGLGEQDAAYALSVDEIERALQAAGTADEAVDNGSCQLR